MLKFKKLFLSLLTVSTFIVCTSTASQPLKGGWLWKISGNGLSQPSYLFGTYHGTYDILYGYVDSIPGFRQAFNTCSQYVGEVVTPEGLESITSELNIKMPKDTTYANLLNEKDYHFLDSIVHQNLHVSLNQVFITPNYLSLILSKLKQREELAKSGYSKIEIDSITSQVMDNTLEIKAKEKGYVLVGLETTPEQINLLTLGNDLKKQAAALIAGLQEDNEYSSIWALGKTLPKVYRAQNIKYLIDFETKTDSLYQVSAKLKAERKQFQEVLLDHRNINWINKLPEIIKDKSTFIAVGVRHLPGKKGLIALLLEKGYRVEAVE